MPADSDRPREGGDDPEAPDRGPPPPPPARHAGPRGTGGADVAGAAAPEETLSAQRFRKAFLLLLVLGISLLFLLVIRRFLLAVLLAAVFAGLARPLYEKLLGWLAGRRTLASVATILVVMLLVGIPLLGFLGLVAAQAVEVSQAAGPWLERRMAQSGQIERLVDRIPFVDRVPALRRLVPDGEQVVARAAEAAARTGSFLVNSLAAATRGTLTFFLQLFVVLYAMYFFLVDGRRILDRIRYYTPLASEDEERLLDRFVSVTRATLKGSLLIGVLQGALAGTGFWVAGVPGAAFWGTIMVVLSIIPAVGAPLVWIPAVVYLFVTGSTGAALALLAWCGIVVGAVDNLLRPLLVGRDTKMSDLLILLSTLGGIVLFGAVGFIVGPIVAALFVTVWDLYGRAFADVLPEVRPIRLDAEVGAQPAPSPEAGRSAEPGR